MARTEEERVAYAARLNEREEKKRQRLKERKVAEPRPKKPPQQEPGQELEGHWQEGGEEGQQQQEVKEEEEEEEEEERQTKQQKQLQAQPKQQQQQAQQQAVRKPAGGSVVPDVLYPPYEAFLKYLPGDVTETQIESFFEGYGEIVPPGPKLMRHHNSGQVILAFVPFADEASLRRALSRDLTRMGTRSVSVSVATSKGTMQQDGTHTPGMAAECLQSIGVHDNPNGVFVDGTFGRGGHSRLILNSLGPRGTLHAFDMDPEAIVAGRALEEQDKRFHIHHAPFSAMADVLLGPCTADAPSLVQGSSSSGSFLVSGALRTGGKAPFVMGVLLDIGISSPQLDGNRGFRPEMDGPLDMRFDTSPGVESALEFLLRASRTELAAAIEKYGGEHPLTAQRIADAVALAKRPEWRGVPLAEMGTKAFAALVAGAKGKEYQAMHPAKMTFQALRVQVNREFLELKDGLAASLEVLLPNAGRVAVLSWKHSECAIVVDFQRKHEIALPDAPLSAWYSSGGFRGEGRGGVSPAVGCIVEEALRPTVKEIQQNSRSRSAVLHVLRKAVGLRLDDLERAAHGALGWEAYPAGDADAPAAILTALDPKLSRAADGGGKQGGRGGKEGSEKARKGDGKRRRGEAEGDGGAKASSSAAAAAAAAAGSGLREAATPQSLCRKFLKAAKKLLKAAPGRRMRAKALLAALAVEAGVGAGAPGSRAELAGVLGGDGAKARLAMDGKDVVLMDRE
ncbi:hypothetical protein FOA52_007858 [Chlamydomonas sp. UWO 241]|nr:hypothetical protein FOA52_007858 [Chlamydomonas sp. UWO 241]